MSHIIECDFRSECDSSLRTGRRFGRLVLVDKAGTLRDGTQVWRCVCDCDHVLWATDGELLSGEIRECGLCAALGNTAADRNDATALLAAVVS